MASTLASSRKTTESLVASSRRSADEFADAAGWIFDGWRRFLGRIARVLAVRARLERARDAARTAVTYLRRPDTLGNLDPPSIDSLTAIGIRALILGSVASIAVGWLTAGALGVPVARAIGSIVWAAARLAILIALGPRGRESHLRVYGAWTCSLIPFAFGVTEGLRLLTLAASAWLCLEGLVALGERRRIARTMVLWSFGGQAGVIALGWLLRGGIAAITALL